MLELFTSLIGGLVFCMVLVLGWDLVVALMRGD